MPDVETSRGIVWGNQGQAPVIQCIAVFPAYNYPFEAVGQNTHDVPACLERSAHRGLIDSPGAAGYHRAVCCGREPSYLLGVLDQRHFHVPGADDRQTTRVQECRVTAAVEDRRSVVSSETLLQSLGIADVGPAHDPDRPRAPAFHCQTKKESSAKQPFESSAVQVDPALLHKRVRAETQ